MKQCTTLHSQRGFTMVVIAALFIAFSIMVAAIVERNTVTQQITRRDAAAAQLSKLANAIIEYSVFNRNGSSVNLYPCPAELNLLSSNAAFGQEVANCSSSLPVGSSVTNPGGGNVLNGMVPVQALSRYGVAPEDAFDPWNNKIVYVVNKAVTVGSGGSQNIEIVLNDPWSSYTIKSPDFILISLGKDGAGAYKRDNYTSGPPSPDIACPNDGHNRSENCNGDVTFFIGPTYTAGDATTTTYFDDILTYYRQ